LHLATYDARESGVFDTHLSISEFQDEASFLQRESARGQDTSRGIVRHASFDQDW
jgi:hypothetical protein